MTDERPRSDDEERAYRQGQKAAESGLPRSTVAWYSTATLRRAWLEGFDYV